MEIIPCLLDTGNRTRIGSHTLGELIALKGKEMLWEERTAGVIDTVVIHYMSAMEVMPASPFALELILKIFADFGVSSHYLIDREGVVRQLVAEEKKAWHCGGSIMPPPDSRQGVNDFSIGIELIATAASGFTDNQYRAAALLCRSIESRYGVMRYVGHEDIAGPAAVALGLRSDMKHDPGPLFDWAKFHGMRESASE